MDLNTLMFLKEKGVIQEFTYEDKLQTAVGPDGKLIDLHTITIGILPFTFQRDIVINIGFTDETKSTKEG